MICQVLKYQLTYPSHDLYKFKRENKCYMSSLIMQMLKEAERNFIPERIGKATKKGTSIKYKCVYERNLEDLNIINNYINDYNKKYNAKIPGLKFYV